MFKMLILLLVIVRENCIYIFFVFVVNTPYISSLSKNENKAR